MGLKLPDICLIGVEKPRKTFTQETYPDRGSNPGPLRDRRAFYLLLHSGGRICIYYGETEYLAIDFLLNFDNLINAGFLEREIWNS